MRFPCVRSCVMIALVCGCGARAAARDFEAVTVFRNGTENYNVFRIPAIVRAVNGDLLAQTLTARSLDLNTVNGDVRVSGWSGERAHIRSLDGDMDLQTSLTKGGRYEIESHSGDIQLSLSEQPGFELEAHTFSGRIRIDFPIKSEGPIRDDTRGPRSIRGTYGDASSSLRIQTFSGNLTVTRR